MIDTGFLRLLEKDQIEKIASQYEAEGYLVSKPSKETDADDEFDLIAKKNGKTVAVEVKAGPLLKQSLNSINELRRRTWQKGYNEFRLFVVNPPHDRKVEIMGIESVLMKHLLNGPPDELKALGSNATLEDVSLIDLDQVTVSKDHIHAVGTGLVDVTLKKEGWPDGGNIKTDFPLRFDILLDHDLQIKVIQTISLDMSSFDDIE